MSEKTARHYSFFPLLWPAAAFAVGIVLQAEFDIGPWQSASVCLIAGAAALALSPRTAATVALLVCFNAPAAVKQLYDSGDIASAEPVEVDGSIFGFPEPAFDGYFVQLNVFRLTYKGSSRDVSGRVRLFVPVLDAESGSDLDRLRLAHGVEVHVDCVLEREDKFNNPGVRPFRELLDQQGIDATSTLKSPLLIERISGVGSVSAIGPVLALRSAAIESIKRLFSTETTGVLAASMLGDRHFIDRRTADVFREGGTFHILVISGLHVTFIGGLIVLLVRRFTRRSILLFLIPTLILWAFTFAVGADVPVVRASLMFTILLLSRVIYRQGTLLNSLAFSGLILLVWRPQDLFTPSFLLTFVSVATIVAVAFPLIAKLRAVGRWFPSVKEPFPPSVPAWLRRFCETIYWNERSWAVEKGRQIWRANIFKRPLFRRLEELDLKTVLSFVFEGLLVSLIVQVAMLPLSVWYFHRVSVVSVFLNLWAGVLLALESFAAVAALLLDRLWSPLAFLFVAITELFNNVLVSVPGILVDADWASFRVPVYSGHFRFVYFVYFVPVLLAAFLLHRWDPFRIERRKNFAGLAVWAVVGVIGAVIALHPYSSPNPDGRLTVDFLDVGQGDSALVTFPDGKTMLVDGGGRQNYGEEGDLIPDAPKIGEQVVSEFLWEKGYSKVDYIVATHADADHIQGLADVVSNFSCGRVILGRRPAGDADLNELLAAARKRNVPIELTGSGESFEIAGVMVEVLSPAFDASPDAASDNNHSLVLRLTYGDRSFLLTGDVEQLAETQLLSSGSVAPADVVKVPHHGSRTSSTPPFVDAVHARYAVVSAPKRSPFGHPHAEIVHRWQNAGAETVMTGRCGTITISTDSDDLRVSSYLPGCFGK